MKFFLKLLPSFLRGEDRQGKATSQIALFIIILVFSVMLAACSSSEEGTNQGSDTENKEDGIEEVASSEMKKNEEEQNEEEEVENQAEETESEEKDYTELESCEGILLVPNEEISGSDLANCIVEAMVIQETGTHIVKDSTGEMNTIDFRWNPQFSMSVDNEEMAAIVKEDTGWVQIEGEWIQEDSTSTEPEVIMATALVNAYRGFGDPRFIAEYLGMVSTWTVVGEESVPDSDAFTDTAWKLTTDDVIDMEIAKVTDLEFWITSDYLGAYYVGTGTAGDITVTTSNTFTQWGGEVDIPDPE